MKPTLAILVFGEIYNYMNIVSILLFHILFLFFVRIAIQCISYRRRKDPRLNSSSSFFYHYSLIHNILGAFFRCVFVNFESLYNHLEHIFDIQRLDKDTKPLYLYNDVDGNDFSNRFLFYKLYHNLELDIYIFLFVLPMDNYTFDDYSYC